MVHALVMYHLNCLIWKTNHVNQINKLVIIFFKTRILEFTRDDHVWFIQYGKCIPKFITLLKGLKYKYAKFIFIC